MKRDILYSIVRREKSILPQFAARVRNTISDSELDKVEGNIKDSKCSGWVSVEVWA
jgi:hypothetical protein